MYIYVYIGAINSHYLLNPLPFLTHRRCIMSKKSNRNERDAKTGRYVKTGTEKKRPARTVTEPRPRSKPRKK